jgi:hypothetical protein
VLGVGAGISPSTSVHRILFGLRAGPMVEPGEAVLVRHQLALSRHFMSPRRWHRDGGSGSAPMIDTDR